MCDVVPDALAYIKNLKEEEDNIQAYQGLNSLAQFEFENLML